MMRLSGRIRFRTRPDRQETFYSRKTMTAQRDATTGSARNRIMDAAEDLICTRGIAGFTLDAVAPAAEVSKGGLLYHFHL